MMQHSTTVSKQAPASGKAPVRGTFPLAFLAQGACASVQDVRGGSEQKHHLEGLGFVSGAPVSVVCENGGNLIVDVKGARVALNHQLAGRIMVVES